MSTGKCSKKLGEYCRLHNPQGIRDKNSFFGRQEADPLTAARKRWQERLALKQANPAYMPPSQLAQQAREAIAREHAVRDFEKNYKLTVKVNGEKTASVYRSGVPTAPLNRGVEKESYEYADAFKPADRQGRMTGVFSSPTMYGMSRWFEGNLMMTNTVDALPRELRVNPDSVYVYSIPAWEKASSAFNPETERWKKAVDAYWGTGITLTDWVEKFKNDPTINPQNWESFRCFFPSFC
jgi:hypothetical protein